MGQPRLVYPGLIVGCVLALLAGCGGEAELLAKADLEEIYEDSGGGGGGYGHTASERTAVLAGKVTYAGRKRARKLQLYKDYCVGANPNGIMSEDFLVGPGGELSNVVVYVKRGLSRLKFPVPAEPVVLDQKSCRYVPHVAIAQTGQEIRIKNSDQHEHNVHGMPGVNGEFNEPMPTVGWLPTRSFSRQQVAMAIKCDIHGWMESYLAILPHPCAALTAEDGSFSFQLPPGKYQIAAWHEALGELTMDVQVGASETKTQDFHYPGK
jgi:hypothetical protein